MGLSDFRCRFQARFWHAKLFWLVFHQHSRTKLAKMASQHKRPGAARDLATVTGD